MVVKAAHVVIMSLFYWLICSVCILTVRDPLGKA